MVKADGSVVGTFHHVTGYAEFSSEPDEQEGYYFPFHLTKTGTKMTFKKNGSPTKQDIAFDPDIIFRVTKDDTFEVLVGILICDLRKKYHSKLSHIENLYLILWR